MFGPQTNNISSITKTFWKLPVNYYLIFIFIEIVFIAISGHFVLAYIIDKNRYKVLTSGKVKNMKPHKIIR